VLRTNYPSAKFVSHDWIRYESNNMHICSSHFVALQSLLQTEEAYFRKSICALISDDIRRVAFDSLSLTYKHFLIVSNRLIESICQALDGSY